MADVLKVAKREYLENVRKKSFLMLLFGMPLLMLGIFAIQYYFGSQIDSESLTAPIGFVDYSGIGFQGDGNMTIAFASVAEAKAALLSGSVDSVILIGPDYLANGTIVSLVRKGDLLRPTSTAGVQKFLVAGVLKGVPQSTLDRVLSPPAVSTVEIDAAGNPVKSDLAKTIVGVAVGILLLFAIFMSSSLLMQSVMEEKESRVIEIILSSISAKDLMAGKILGLGALALTQIGVWLVLGLAIVTYVGGGQVLAMIGGANPLDLLPLPALAVNLLYFIGGFLLYSSILAAIGAVSTSSKETQQVSAIVIVPAASPLWFITAFAVEPNGPIAQFLSFFPLSSPLAMIIRNGLTDVPVMELAGSLLLLYAAVAFSVWASAKIFRASILMYGQRPGLGQILSMLRRA